jgi:anthranilate phosphoribosyltransferase
MKSILNRLINHEILSKDEAKNVLINISSGAYNPSQIAAFMTVYMMRSITIDELSGFKEALQELCIKVDFSAYDTIDLCGTGGDGKDTFNISTLASFIVAGAGYKVAKHGNYGVSSISGSSNVMEKMGVTFTNDNDFLKKSLETCHIAILHAPLFHPAMKNVGPIRKELGVKTFFNMLGPMVNPSFPKFQMVGVFSLELARMYAYLYQNTNLTYSILHGLDGFDEISLTDEVKIISNLKEQLLKPEDFKLPYQKLQAIKGGETIEASADIFYKVISGEGSVEQNNVVCVNAAVAISTISQKPFEESLHIAQESLLSGQAKLKLDQLIQLSR